MLFKRKEIAKLLRVSIPTLQRFIDEGKIGYVDIGAGSYRGYRFTQEHLDEFLRENEIQVS